MTKEIEVTTRRQSNLAEDNVLGKYNLSRTLSNQIEEQRDELEELITQCKALKKFKVDTEMLMVTEHAVQASKLAEAETTITALREQIDLLNSQIIQLNDDRLSERAELNNTIRALEIKKDRAIKNAEYEKNKRTTPMEWVCMLIMALIGGPIMGVAMGFFMSLMADFVLMFG